MWKAIFFAYESKEECRTVPEALGINSGLINDTTWKGGHPDDFISDASQHFPRVNVGGVVIVPGDVTPSPNPTFDCDCVWHEGADEEGPLPKGWQWWDGHLVGPLSLYTNSDGPDNMDNMVEHYDWDRIFADAGLVRNPHLSIGHSTIADDDSFIAMSTTGQSVVIDENYGEIEFPEPEDEWNRWYFP